VLHKSGEATATLRHPGETATRTDRGHRGHHASPSRRLIAKLELRPHPEGGYYREIFRSAAPGHASEERGVRAALTTIYFLLTEGSISRWHQVASDEVWHLYEGGPLELLELSDMGHDLSGTG
jgi:predicted cupin superfamily sugar epimerase